MMERVANAPLKFTRARQRDYVELLRQGTRRGVAAEAVGVHPGTPRRLMAEDADFNREVLEAERLADELIEKVAYDKAAAGDSRAVEFWLRNRRPHEWNAQHRVALGGDPVGGPLEIAAAPTRPAPPPSEALATLSALEECGVAPRGSARIHAALTVALGHVPQDDRDAFERELAKAPAGLDAGTLIALGIADREADRVLAALGPNALGPGDDAELLAHMHSDETCGLAPAGATKLLAQAMRVDVDDVLARMRAAEEGRRMPVGTADEIVRMLAA